MNNRLFSALAVTPFFFLWVAEIFSQLAMNMVNFVLIIVAFELTRSNTAVSAVVLAYTIPAIAFGIIAGVYVDYWNKKSVLFVTNLLRAAFLVLLALFHSQLAMVYLLAFATAIVTQFFIPAETPMIPLLVKKKQLLAANALFGMGVYGSALVAYALSGPFLIFFGKTAVFSILAFLFLLGAFVVSFIKIDTNRISAKQSQLRPTITQEMKSLFSILKKTREVSRSIMLLILSQLLVLILGVIGPGFASQVMGIPVNQFPIYFITPAAFGMVIGAIVVVHYFYNANKQRLATLGVLLSGLAILLLPNGSKIIATSTHSNPLAVMVFLAFTMGFANAFVFVPSNTLVQEKTADELRGKVYGLLNAFTGVFSLVPVILVGGLADMYGVASVLTVIGVILLALGIFRLFIS